MINIITEKGNKDQILVNWNEGIVCEKIIVWGKLNEENWTSPIRKASSQIVSSPEAKRKRPKVMALIGSSRNLIMGLIKKFPMVRKRAAQSRV